MGERLDPTNQEIQIAKARRSQMVTEVIGASPSFGNLPDEDKAVATQRLAFIAQTLEERYSGRWNSARWGFAWIEMLEEEDPSLTGALEMYDEEAILDSFKGLFHMYEAGVTTLEALKQYKNLKRIKSPQFPRRTVDSSIRRSKRNKFPIE